MRRRTFLATLASAPAVAQTAARAEGRIMTVRGPIAPSDAGTVLPHEHVMSIFGAAPADIPDYPVEQLMAAAVPYLKKIRELGCATVADCTAARFGRAPELLRRISVETGVHLLTNTGYYGAAKDRYVPPQAMEQTATEIAAIWLKEWRDGIGGTGIRPGFLKIGVDPGRLSPIDRKLIEAAALTHRESGLTIAVHTGDNPEAVGEQLGILRAAGVSPRAWIWVHAHAVRDEKSLEWAAGQGAWLSFDGISESSLDRHLELVRYMRRTKRLGQVLLSHDGNAFPAPGAKPKPFDALFTHGVPRLRQAGLSAGEVGQLLDGNPQRALTVAIRRG